MNRTSQVMTNKFFYGKINWKDIGRIIMNEEKIDHTLIDYILTLLNTYENKKIDSSIEQDTQLPPIKRQYIRLAYEIIKFMDEMPGGFLIYYAEQGEKIIYANKSLLRIFQCNTLQEFRELTKNSFQGIVHPEDLEEVEQSIKEQIAADQYDLDYVEYRIIRKDEEIRWVEDYGHFIHSSSIGSNIFYVFIGDATQKRKQMAAEKAAFLYEKKQHEQKMQNLIEEYDKERKLINQEHLRRLEVIEGLSVNYESILYADLNADTILPYRLSERTDYQFEKKLEMRSFLWFTSNYVATWVHPEDREIVSKATTPEYIRKQLSINQTYYINYRVLTKGEVQYLQLRIVNVGNKKAISQIVMGYRRVDEEVRQEIEQKQILENALNNANLAITAKNAFLSNMSHDMRTPLNAIFGFTTLAKQHLDDSKTLKTYLDNIESSSKQLLEQIEKVLQISWIETNDIQVAEDECNLCDILQDVHKTLALQASEKNIHFSLNSANLKHCDIYSDPDKLKQVLLYLANNAITYTEHNGNVSITATEVEQLPNDYVVYQFIIEDTGIGISEDFLKHIYEPFEREKNTTFSGIHGTGLGLTIAKKIIDRMGGTIKVNSIINKGTTFTVTIHLRVQTHPCSLISNTKDIIAHLMNQKILLVDDTEVNLIIETEILQELGFLIETATDGSIAVKKVKNSKPGEYALVLMDIQMPIMDGRQAAKEIRKLNDPILSRIPIIALSADAFESDKRISIESGMDAHLTKPIDVQQLLETIAKTIQAHTLLYGKETSIFDI